MQKVAAAFGLLTVVIAVGTWAGHRLDPTFRAAAAPGSANRVPAFGAVDQRGAPVSDQDLRGHVWVADFVFTSCTGTCPLLSARMAALRRAVRDRGARFVSFSVDPDRDTPPVLAAYATRWGPPDDRWRLLHLDRAALARVAAAFGIATADDAPIHSDRLFVVDRAGVIAAAASGRDERGAAELARLMTAAVSP